MDPHPIFPVITPLILVRRGPKNEVGAGGGGGGGHQGQTEGARLVLEATFREPNVAIIKELEKKKCVFEKS